MSARLRRAAETMHTVRQNVASDAELAAVADHMRQLGPLRWAWAFGFLFDLGAVTLVFPDARWGWVLGCRALGVPMQPMLVRLARDRRVKAPTVGLLTVANTIYLVLLMALQAVELGGLLSPYVFQMLVFMFAGALVVFVRPSRIVGIVSCWFFVWVAVMAAAGGVRDDIAAQWRDPRALGLFVGYMSLLAILTGGGLLSAYRIARLRRELDAARKLAGYRIKMRIGIGGMNEVWLAWDELNHRDVALKILRGSSTTEAVRRFEREAAATRALQSPHTVRVLDFGASDDGVMYLAMEYLDGLDLEKYVLEHGAMHPGRAVNLMLQACRSLGEAHARGIVHRDIKPSNLYIVRADDGDDHLKLLDFGIARVANGDTRLTAEGHTLGTPHFMAPEAFQNVDVDARADLYGLGATLYYLVTGQRPFEGLSGWVLASASTSREPTAPSALRPGLPTAFDVVILRLLSPDLDARFASVKALESALLPLAAFEPWRREDAQKWWARPLRPAQAVPSDAPTANHRGSLAPTRQGTSNLDDALQPVPHDSGKFRPE